MEVNVGRTDRTLRILFGIVLILLTVTGTIGSWGWLGLLPLVTGLLRFCPVYALFGKHTCGNDKPIK